MIEIYKMKSVKLFIGVLILIILTGNSYSRVTSTVKSPDKSISLDIINSNGQLGYMLSKETEVIIDKSEMLWSVNDILMGIHINEVKILNERMMNTKYPVRGNHSMAVNRFNEVLFKITSFEKKLDFILQVKVFNDGIAFRYIADYNGENEVNDFTTFSLPENTRVWSQNDISYYEGTYRQQDVDSLEIKQLAGPPVVVRYPHKNLYSAITEGGLYDFAGMALQVSDKRTFKALLSGKTIKTGRIETPWRIIMIGDLNTLVNSDIVTNVSEKPDKELFQDASSWINPGLCLWSWLTDYNIRSDYKVTFDDMKLFSKWAGELGILYNLVDYGWGYWKEDDKDCWDLMKELVEYSEKYNVKILLWKAYPDMHGIEGINTPPRWENFLRKCKEVGVVGIKIDYFNNEGQEITRFYHDALKDAAKYKLVVNFHGSNKPTGLSYTFPNELSREGIQGNEAGVDPVRATILPFTRLLAGHGDYTPLFLNMPVKDFNERYSLGGTTWCHQISSTLIFSSPLLCLSANPEDILKNPHRNFICSIPTVWDESIVLPPSEIGELVLMARRSGEVWYIAGLTHKARPQVNINLSFLGKGNYIAHVITDLPDQQNNSDTEEITVTAKHNLSVEMNPNGGFIAKIVPQK